MTYFRPIRRMLGRTKWAVMDGGWRELQAESRILGLDKRLGRQLAALPPQQCTPSGDAGVYILCGAKHTTMAVMAVRNLLQYGDEQLSVTFLSDGTMTKANQEFISTRLPGSRVVDEAELDEIFNRRFPVAKFPALRALASQNFGGRKLVYLNMVGVHNARVLLDGDILFYRHPVALYDAILRASAGDRSMFFMEDIMTAYPCRATDLADRCGQQVPEALNAGVMVHRTPSEDDFELMESILERFDQEWRQHYFIEQAVYAALAAHRGWCYLPGDYLVVEAGTKFERASTTCAHFAGRRNRERYYQEALALVCQPVGSTKIIPTLTK